eukprot:CAMPEP_0184364536 /NCGR_PEP_ID=MMETSP1089-20130417/144673_1 /TAXON_ID=38269 ORGANISM="Gloeochaete wittrockiana, Strain SAG46.84" /NCGR_SAMPLE_ID=MMETSP1089 /ASSEMBLY_ACC=CAM_ASM_000445 /LENGTH=257 /DNA_ID=CAMNT_0026705443 /DNA_START=139 /DNA_END=908 /DNA_ORIENTATION=+
MTQGDLDICTANALLQYQSNGTDVLGRRRIRLQRLGLSAPIDLTYLDAYCNKTVPDLHPATDSSDDDESLTGTPGRSFPRAQDIQKIPTDEEKKQNELEAALLAAQAGTRTVAKRADKRKGTNIPFFMPAVLTKGCITAIRGPPPMKPEWALQLLAVAANSEKNKEMAQPLNLLSPNKIIAKDLCSLARADNSPLKTSVSGPSSLLAEAIPKPNCQLSGEAESPSTRRRSSRNATKTKAGEDDSEQTQMKSDENMAG